MPVETLAVKGAVFGIKIGKHQPPPGAEQFVEKTQDSGNILHVVHDHQIVNEVKGFRWETLHRQFAKMGNQVGKVAFSHLLLHHPDHFGRAVHHDDFPEVAGQGETQQSGAGAEFQGPEARPQGDPLHQGGRHRRRPFLILRILVPIAGLMVKFTHIVFL